VVALVNGEAAVKRYYREDERVELRGVGERSPPLVADSSAVELRGVVVALLRTYA
jgi:SOS-response transcriptional repressor LexA